MVHTVIKHPVSDWVKLSFVIFTSGHSYAQPWASECPDVKNYKWRLNPVWHRMRYSCTHMAAGGVKGLMSVRRQQLVSEVCFTARSRSVWTCGRRISTLRTYTAHSLSLTMCWGEHSQRLTRSPFSDAFVTSTLGPANLMWVASFFSITFHLPDVELSCYFVNFQLYLFYFCGSYWSVKWVPLPMWNSLPVVLHELAVSNGVFQRTLKMILLARYQCTKCNWDAFRENVLYKYILTFDTVLYYSCSVPSVHVIFTSICGMS